MNEHERSQLERLKERQLLLLDRFNLLEKRIRAEDNELLTARRAVEELRREFLSLQQQRQVLDNQLQALEARLQPISPAEEIAEVKSLAPSSPASAPLESVETEIPEETQRKEPEPVPPTVIPVPDAIKPPPIPPLIPQPMAGATVRPQAEPTGLRPAPAPVAPSPRAQDLSKTPAPVESTPAARERGSFEMRLGTYWLVRIGIVMLLTGLVFFGSYAHKYIISKLGAGGKVTLLYLLGGVLLGVGSWLYRKQETLKNYAQVLIAGGLATVYFTTYAAHHVPTLEVIHSALLDGVLLLGWAGFMVWLADRQKSEVLALFGIGLAYYTAVMTRVGFFTLYSNLVLTLAAVFFLVRNRWATLSIASLAATYGAYVFWRFYHGGEWHWASPTEGLWSGIYFLMAYWALFTAAGFLSTHPLLTGKKRMSFLSLNNAALFALFLLTMLQVHHGGFWKFALGYGAVLIFMAILSEQFLEEEPLTANAYLTQGLLLGTLGFITYFTGLKLALVLGAESVVLVVLGRALGNRVLQVGAYVAALLGAGWGLFALRPFDVSGQIIGSALGAFMLFNAFWDRSKAPAGATGLAPQTVFFTGLGLLLWGVTTWENLGPEWRGLAFAGESVVFLLASRPLGNLALRYAAYPFAALGAGWGVFMIVDPLGTGTLSQTLGIWEGAIIGGLLVFNAVWEQRRRAAAGRLFDPAAAVFVGLGLLSWLATTWKYVPNPWLAPALASEALLFTAAFYPLRLAELALLGQTFLVAAQFHCLTQLWTKQAVLPWWNPVWVLAATLGLSHWWQRQKSLRGDEGLRQLWQGVYALATVGVLFFWLRLFFDAPGWLGITSLLAVAVTIYGVAMRAWLLAAFGQLFLWISAVEFVRQLYFGGWPSRPGWVYALAPLVTFPLISLGVLKWVERHPPANAEVSRQITGVGLVYRIVAVLLTIAWVFTYIPERQRFWVFALLGGVFFLGSGWKQNRESLLIGATFTLVGFVAFWGQIDKSNLVSWPNLLAILFLLLQQRVAKRLPDKFILPERAHTAMVLLGAITLWRFVSLWVVAEAGGEHVYLTAAWALLALVIFGTGFLWRDRTYRWAGLAVLACALGRVVFFDVWRLPVIYRVLSFMALGVVLLVLGFIYNRYQEKIREWL